MLSADLGRILGELLELHAWAGSTNSVSPARIYGLLNGFESVLEEERQQGISNETQEAVDEWLESIEAHDGELTGLHINDGLRRRGIDENDARRVLEWSLLANHYTDTIERIKAAPGSPFHAIGKHAVMRNAAWYGALHYMELVDTTTKRKWAVFAPAVPRVGEVVTPERGQTMVVQDVEYLAVPDDRQQQISRTLLIPYVSLAPEEE